MSKRSDGDSGERRTFKNEKKKLTRDIIRGSGAEKLHIARESWRKVDDYLAS